MIERYRAEEIPDGRDEWVRYSDHLAALRSVRQILSEMCPKCQGTMLDEGGTMRCVQCRFPPK